MTDAELETRHREGQRADLDEDFAITVDDVVQHTDSGSGNSQKAHWESNVSTPEG